MAYGEIKRDSRKVTKAAARAGGRKGAIKLLNVGVAVFRTGGYGGAHRRYTAHACPAKIGRGHSGYTQRSVNLAVRGRCKDGHGSTPTRATKDALFKMARALK